MNALKILSHPAEAATMSSREIAALTEKRHDNVLADIRKMLFELNEDELSFQDIYFDSMNRRQTGLKLDRELTETLLTGYSAVLRRKVIARWRELEGAAAKAPELPNFSDPVAAARAWANAMESAQAFAVERDKAVADKALIGERREATAMNTASQAVKRANKLEQELDRAKSYATIKRMEMQYHGTPFNWRLLKSATADMGIPSIDVFDANYGTVKAYHADVWRETYALEI